MLGGTLVVRDLKAAKKHYSAPAFHILDPGSAQLELETIGASHDANTRQMRSAIDQQLESKASAARPALAKTIAEERLLRSAEFTRGQ
jgi:hypothetical protein